MVTRKTECDACGKIRQCERVDTYNIIWICKDCLKKSKIIIKDES